MPKRMLIIPSLFPAITAALVFCSCPKPQGVRSGTTTSRPAAARRSAPVDSALVTRFWTIAKGLKDGRGDLQALLGPLGVAVHKQCRGPAELKVVNPQGDDPPSAQARKSMPTMVALLRSSDKTTHCSKLTVASCALILSGDVEPRLKVVPLPIKGLHQDASGGWVRSRRGQYVLDISSTGPSCEVPDDDMARIHVASLAVLRFSGGGIKNLLEEQFVGLFAVGSNASGTAVLIDKWFSEKPTARHVESRRRDLLVTVWIERTQALNTASYAVKRRVYRLSPDGKTLKLVLPAELPRVLALPQLKEVRSQKAMITLAEEQL